MITIYSKTECAFCVQAKNILESHDIPFKEVNIEENDESREFLMNKGHRSVPQIYVGETMLVRNVAELNSMSSDLIKQRVKELL